MYGRWLSADFVFVGSAQDPGILIWFPHIDVPRADVDLVRAGGPRRLLLRHDRRLTSVETPRECRALRQE